ncbi:hypothetical protein HU200_050800 [Digitaria exilis]|uniref:Uncharacterized protein n=1 Tax=Digitaria exilis TaxID=1010633 RepID=A0A835AR53_9POAL|nr:hypothetical protein HU200_050800 [Digitaria exilis]
MRDMGEKRRHGGGHHVHGVGFGVGGHAEHDEKHREPKKLDMSGMSMGTIPHLSMPLGNITTLDLSNNNLQLKSLPNSIGCLSKLKVLNVSGNLLHELPATIEECRALEELNANFNELTKLPDTLGFELHGLRRLSVNSNKLAYLPSSTSHMTSLRLLDARLNCLRSLPDGLENLGSLETLNVSQNFQYLRELPYGIGLLVSLRELDISYNSIAELPDSMGCLTKLARFSAAGNPLVSPPMDVVNQSLDAMRAYLSARINGTGAKDRRKKKSWVPKLVHGSAAEGLLMSDYRSIDGGGIASPGFLSMLSPRRLFSPRRNSHKH